MDVPALLTGGAALLGAFYKLLVLFYQKRARYKAHTMNVKHHILYTGIREWRHSLINIQYTNEKKEVAIKSLVKQMLKTLETRCSIVSNHCDESKFELDIIQWHMDTVDQMYNECIGTGIPEVFVNKFRKWNFDNEAMITQAVKLQSESYHESIVHLIDDILKDYYILWGHVFMDIEKLKNDFLKTLNGEADSLLEGQRYLKD